MSELRQLLRFEIPGLILIIEITLTLICFVNLSVMLQYDFTKDVFKYFIIGAPILALPIGWIVYQIYDAIYMPHYKKRSIQTLKEMIKVSLREDGTANKDSDYEELLDFILFSGDKIKVAESLRSYWDYHDARYVIGKYIPIIWLAITAIIAICIYVDGRYFFCPKCSIFREMILIFVIVYNIVSYRIIYRGHSRILEEIDAREHFLIIHHEEDINNINHRSWSGLKENGGSGSSGGSI